jgi:hypothetical protein
VTGYPQPGDNVPGAPPALRNTPNGNTPDGNAPSSSVPSNTPARPGETAAVPGKSWTPAAPAAPASTRTALLRSPGVLVGVVLTAAAAGIALGGRRR